jgi:hypothetical protein
METQSVSPWMSWNATKTANKCSKDSHSHSPAPLNVYDQHTALTPNITKVGSRPCPSVSFSLNFGGHAGSGCSIWCGSGGWYQISTSGCTTGCTTHTSTAVTCSNYDVCWLRCTSGSQCCWWFQDTYLKPLRIFNSVIEKNADVWTLILIRTELL